MKNPTQMNKVSALLGGCLVALLLSGSAFAQGHGGGGGGGHAGGGGGGGHAAAGGYHGGGYHGGGYGGGYYHGGYGYRGGYYGGYGYRGGYYGWRGGWGCCGWGWGWGGLGVGLYFATLPLYYSTYYWGGVPYYYSNDTYYTWDPNANQYQTVAPPAGLEAQVGQSPLAAPGGAPPPSMGGGGPSMGTDLIAYPKNGQTPDQQAKDKFECHQWAVSQSGFDPSQGTPTAANKRTDYMRAQAACLEGRGYSVQ
jgi:hypothetical protein